VSITVKYFLVLVIFWTGENIFKIITSVPAHWRRDFCRAKLSQRMHLSAPPQIRKQMQTFKKVCVHIKVQGAYTLCYIFNNFTVRVRFYIIYKFTVRVCNFLRDYNLITSKLRSTTEQMPARVRIMVLDGIKVTKMFFLITQMALLCTYVEF
jgi:hypothetical protein